VALLEHTFRWRHTHSTQCIRRRLSSWWGGVGCPRPTKPTPAVGPPGLFPGCATCSSEKFPWKSPAVSLVTETALVEQVGQRWRSRGRAEYSSRRRMC